jgi:sodium-coupled neutral amino acid transporter 11
LTIFLYLTAVIPAAWFQNLGTVLAASGAVGGSCLAYIGPGAVYLGVHGARFLELSRVFFGHALTHGEQAGDEELAPLYNADVSGDLPQLEEDDSWLVRQLKMILWYLLLMPIWTAIASYGKSTLTHHVSDLVLKSPHPIRIGNVRFASAQVRGGATRVLMLPQQGSSHRLQQLAAPTITMLIQDDSLLNYASTSDGRVLALPTSSHQNSSLAEANTSNKNYESINDKIGAMAKRKKQEEELALEDDPQQDLPSRMDFVVAIFYIIFGFVAMVAGLVSLYLSSA